MNNILISSTKDSKAEVSIESIKQTVKKLKSHGFKQLSHHQLALALSTVGFSQVCKQFGANWNINCEKEALKILQNSDYELNWYGKTNSLRYANILVLCSRGDIEKVKQLVSSVNRDNRNDLYCTVDNFKRSALHIAVKEGFDVLAEYLINQGFPLNARDRELKTPLHYCKNQLICQVLVNKKAKILVKDNKMCTPVHYAASGADYRCLQILLKAANIVNEKDSTGKSAIFYAIYNTSQQQINVIRILLQNGAKVNDQDMFNRTPLHYAAELGKSRCIPILLRKGASVDALDKHGKSPLDLAQKQQKVKKIILAYCNNKGIIFQDQEQSKRKQLKETLAQNDQNKVNQSIIGHQNQSKLGASKIKGNTSKIGERQNLQNGQGQIFTKQVNQISTWIREKFFVLMKKLQQSGVKAMWHLKRPYVYTGSWAQDVESLEDLYETFLNVNGPEAAMRTFNILCPYEKALPTVLSKSDQAFQSFFGESWFSNDPVEKLRNMHSSSKIRNQLQAKMKQSQDLRMQLLGYKSQIQSLQSKIINLNQQISHYKKVQDQLRRQKNKNTQQYTQILKLMSQNQQLKQQINKFVGGQQNSKVMSNMVDQLRQKNQGLVRQIQTLKIVQAAARRKCGQIFLKSLSLAQKSEQFKVPQENLYDDDAIISLYNLLKGNPPNLEKRFKNADKRGNNKLNIDQFTQMLQDLSMLPQDVMSMHRITGFAYGRKALSLEQFKTILENRHKNRPMWQKNLVRKIKNIIAQQPQFNVKKFFKVMDADGNGTIQATQLRQGLQSFNIFMNQNDWSNLFNLLDSDNSGKIDLSQLETLLEQEKTGKLGQYNPEKAKGQQNQAQKNKNEGQDENQNQENLANQNEKNEQQNNQFPNNNEHEENEKQQNKNQQGQQNQKQSNNQQQKEAQKEPQQEYDEPYQQKDSDDQQGAVKLNGALKMQVPIINLPSADGSLKKVYVKFFVNEDIDSQSSVRLADLTKKKLDVVSELKFIEYKIMNMDELILNVSLWESRQTNEQTFFGQVNVNLKDAIEKPNEWAINKTFKLIAEQFQKDVQGKILLQVKWTPSQIQ